MSEIFQVVQVVADKAHPLTAAFRARKEACAEADRVFALAGEQPYLSDPKRAAYDLQHELRDRTVAAATFELVKAVFEQAPSNALRQRWLAESLLDTALRHEGHRCEGAWSGFTTMWPVGR